MDINHTCASQLSQEKTQELPRVEAEWVSNELQEFVKLLQRYRSLYLTAVFLGIGWVLSQAVSTTSSLANISFDALRFRQDIAALLYFIPFVNVLFGLLMLEVPAQIQTLARYRFLLGFELGENAHAWRWECWKRVRLYRSLDKFIKSSVRGICGRINGKCALVFAASC